MDKEKIVKDLVKNIGLLDEEKIKKALDEQKKTKERFSSALLKLRYISNLEVGRTLISQIGMLPISVKARDIDKKNVNVLPPHIALAHKIVPIKHEANKLHICTDDPLNFLAKNNLEEILGLQIEMELALTDDLERALEELYASKKKTGVDLAKMSEEIKAVKGSEDTPIIKLVNTIINEAIKRRTSDIHIEPLENKFRLRYRVDGVLHEVSGPPKRLQGSVLSRVKIMAGMDIAEKRMPQDGRIKVRVDDREIDLRVSSLPGIHGESIVMRILDKSSFMVGIEDLGFLPDQRKAIETLIKLPNGIMLITGPTGSGKTTTLYAILSHINQ